MNLDTLYEKIKNPSELKAEDLSSLKDLGQKYPFSQLFSILYLKALAQSKDLHFEDEIQQHAFKVTDRAKLHELIYAMEDQVYTADPIIEAEINAAETVPEALPVSDTQPSENQAIESSPIEIEVKTELPAEAAQEKVIEFELERLEMPAIEAPESKIEEEPVYQLQDEVIEDETESKEFLELEKEFLSNVIAASYSIETEETAKQDSEEKKIDLNENRSFSSWLKLSDAKPVKASEKIIEKFIQDDSERIKPKKDFYSAPKKAKESVSDEKLLYTETLANIFALQGNYPKAITAFQHLMLTNPEKKLYFAQKIEELNKKINS